MSGSILLGTTDGIWRGERGDRYPRSIALSGEAVTHLVEDRAGSRYATDGRAIWRSMDRWHTSSAARLPGDRAVTVIAASPHPPYPVYAGSIPAALFRSDDGGVTWREVAGFVRCPGHEQWTFPGPSPQARVNAVAFDAEDPATLYVTVEVGGIIRSRDSGETWENCSEAVNRDGHFLAAHPHEGGVVFASAGFGSRQPGGVYRSADHGTTWAYRFEGLAPAYTRPLVLDHRIDDRIHVAATPQQPPYWTQAEGPGSVLWRGLQGGTEWNVGFAAAQVEHKPPCLISALAADPAVTGGVLIGVSEVVPVLYAIGALGRRPGGPFPPPDPAASPPGVDGPSEIAQVRRELQLRLSMLNDGDRRGYGEVWRLDEQGTARRLWANLPAVLTIAAA